VGKTPKGEGAGVTGAGLGFKGRGVGLEGRLEGLLDRVGRGRLGCLTGGRTGLGVGGYFLGDGAGVTGAAEAGAPVTGAAEAGALVTGA
jgi:hypothetical protein